MAIPTINSSVLFNLNTKQLTYSDNTNYSSFGISTSNVDGNLKCIGPTGIFHNNNSWISPDIDLATLNTKVVNLPTIDGSVYSGTYSFVYTIRVLTSATPNGGTIHNPSNQAFICSGNYAAEFLIGSFFNVTGGPNDGVYSVANVVYNGSLNLTYIYTNESIPVNSTDGILSIYNEYSISQQYDFSDCSIVVEIDLEADCDCSQIVSRNLTNYTMKIGGNYYPPTSIQTVHTLTPPSNPATGSLVTGVIVSSQDTIIQSPLWTTTWTSTIVSNLTYNINGLLVSKTASGSAKNNVQCSDELCCAYSCLGNLVDTYNEFKNTNLDKAQEWMKILVSVLGEWMAYSVARSCGQVAEAQKRLNNLIAITKKAGCACCNDNSAEPVEVVGICSGGIVSGSGANVVVSTCGNGITVTPSTVGSTTTYQVCLDLNIVNAIIAEYLQDNPLSLSDLSDVLFQTPPGSGDFLRFNGQNWVPVDSISFLQITEFSGSWPPATGNVLTWNGSNLVFSPNTGNVIAVEQNTYTSTGNSLQTLKSINIPTGTLSANGDLLEIQSEWIVSSDTANKQIYVGMSGNDFIYSANLNGVAIRRVRYYIMIVRMSSTQVRVEYRYELFGNFGGICFPTIGSNYYYTDPTLYTVNNMDNSTNSIQFRANPTVNTSSISLFSYLIKSFKK